MNVRAYTSTLLACVLLLSACKSSEQTTAPMSQEDQLVEQHIAALGGRDALAGIESLEWTGTVDMPTMNMSLPVTVYMKRPNRVRTEVDVSMMNATVINGYDGEIAWSINPMMGSGPQKLPPDQARQTRQQADIDGPLVDYAAKGYTLEYLGEDEVKGQPTHKLRLIEADSTESIMYLDAASYLPVKTEGEGINPMDGSKTQMTTYFSDYRDVNGVPMAHELTIEMGGQVAQIITLDGAEVNIPMPDDMFAFPNQ